MDTRQELVDLFYHSRGPCCAGCDWWHSLNSGVGECRRSAPVPGAERIGMLGISGPSLPIEAGHVLTRKEHHCGEFKDEFDWSVLPLAYQKRLGISPPRSPSGSETGEKE